MIEVRAASLSAFTQFTRLRQLLQSPPGGPTHAFARLKFGRQGVENLEYERSLGSDIRVVPPRVGLYYKNPLVRNGLVLPDRVS